MYKQNMYKICMVKNAKMLIKEIKEGSKQMARHGVFIDWKTQDSKDVSSP